LVITKGAERVAEVAARFTLDAIPGKQMSIDADLRAGTITFEQARQRREDLSRESQFYGAMDGAMKFVKGDAIAGIIITLINIVAGLIIGVAMNGMTAGDAAQTYSVLTIGSGLVSQIPALLISISAGLVVTRVAGSDSKNSNLGAQVMGQVIAQPKAIGVAAALMLLLALIPGLPKIPFFILAGAVGTVAFQLLKAQKKDLAAETKPELKEAQVAMPEVLATVPVMLRAGSALAPFLSPQTEEGREFVAKMNQIRNSLYMEVGVLYPPVQVSIDPTVPANSLQIYLKETPAFSTAIFGLKGQPGMNPLNGGQATWLPSAAAEQLALARLTAWKPAEVIQLHLTMFLRRNGAEFVGLQEVHSMVERLKQIYPALVEQTIPKPISVPLLTDVLKRLATESVSIRDLKSILESLADWGRTDEDPASLTEYVRSDMRRRLCFQLSRGKAQLHFYSLDPKYEDMFRLSIRKAAGGGQSFAMGSDALDAVLNAAHRAFANRPSTAQPPVILTTRDIRRFVRHVIGSQYPDVSVISNDQLTAEIELSPLGMLA
jgi:type III secretion protein V